MIPTHIQNALALDGVIDTGRVTAKAKPNRCRACHAPTLAGIAEQLGRVDVEPHPTTNVGEVVAALTGRLTFTLIQGQLTDRDPWRIKARDADREPVHAAHQCGAPPTPHNPTHTTRRHPRPDYNQPPPF